MQKVQISYVHEGQLQRGSYTRSLLDCWRKPAWRIHSPYRASKRLLRVQLNGAIPRLTTKGLQG